MFFQKLMASAILCLQILTTVQASADPIELSNRELGNLKLHFCELARTQPDVAGCELPQQYVRPTSSIPDRSEILNCLQTADVLAFTFPDTYPDKTRTLRITFYRHYNKATGNYANEVTCDARADKDAVTNEFKVSGFFKGE